jgi:hypothetical protein
MAIWWRGSLHVLILNLIMAGRDFGLDEKGVVIRWELMYSTYAHDG